MPTAVIFIFKILIYIMGAYSFCLVLIPKYELFTMKALAAVRAEPVVEVTDVNSPISIFPGQSVSYNGEIIFSSDKKITIFHKINRWASIVAVILSIFYTPFSVVGFLLVYLLIKALEPLAIKYGPETLSVRIMNLNIAITAVIAIWCM